MKRIGVALVSLTLLLAGPSLQSSAANLNTPGVLTIGNDGSVHYQAATWTAGTTASTIRLQACMGQGSAMIDESNTQTFYGVTGHTCIDLALNNDPDVLPTNLNQAKKDAGHSWVAYDPSTDGGYILAEETAGTGLNTKRVWTATFNWGAIAQANNSSNSSSEEEVPPPVYFGGPLVQGSTLPHFTQGEEGTVTLTGKRLNKISSATINGVAVTVTADRRSATITVPASLAAGTYDLVLQTTNGRLTVMRFIKVS